MTTDENIFNKDVDEDTNTDSNSSTYGTKWSTVINYTWEAYDLDIKRFHIGWAIIKHICSKCGEEIVEDLDREYLMDSTVNVPIQKVMYCNECSQEDIIFVKVSLNIELLSKDSEEVKNLPVDPDDENNNWDIDESNAHSDNPILDSITEHFFEAMDEITGNLPNNELDINSLKGKWWVNAMDKMVGYVPNNEPVISKDENLIKVANEVFGGDSDEVKML